MPSVIAWRAPPRIISLSPHITELLFAAGAGDRIVGVDDMSDYPPAVAGIARVGEASALDVEGLLKLKPGDKLEEVQLEDVIDTTDSDEVPMEDRLKEMKELAAQRFCRSRRKPHNAK